MLIKTKEDLEPNIKKYLENIDDRFLFHESYGLKHPLAIYNVSFGKIESDLQDFFAIYKSIKVADFISKSQKDEKIKETLKRYKSFLYSLREHLDDCFHIIKSLISPQSQFKDNRNQFDWLKQNINIPCVITLLKNIDSYKKYLDNIVNELKHNNAILNGLVFFDETSEDFLLGYYVANVFNGRYEPVKKIHSKFHGQDTAFSFARDIRYNICNIFQLSEELVTLINELNIKILIPLGQARNEKRLLLYEDIYNLPKCFFPDEYEKDIPSVVVGSKILELDIYSNLSLEPLRHREGLLFHSADGKTNSFALLYFPPE